MARDPHGGAGLVLGPIHLDRLIGEGTSGEVWAGTSVDARLPVAVKVLHPVEGGRADVRLELEAAARLHHPHVIRVYDYGIIDEEAMLAAGDRWELGQPYLVMELAEHGPMRPHTTPWTWKSARDALVQILGALAHAHAKGIVHRDVKPANILLSGPSDERPGFKLTDFGIAQMNERRGSQGRLQGTPRYMAPEQFHAHPDEIGPWTDLYALGVVAWEIITGAPPFTQNDPSQLALDHLYAPLPTFRPRFDVPPGLHGWLQLLLQKNPTRRFKFAADAIAMLQELGPARAGSACSQETAPAAPEAADTLDDFLGGLGMSSADTTFAELLIPRIQQQGQVPATVRTPDLRAAPMPADWRAPHVSEERLPPAAVALFGLRSLPVVGRQQARDRLWERLRQMHQHRRAQGLLMHGVTGVGKSAVARWLCERAHETGAAIPIRARYPRKLTHPYQLRAAICMLLGVPQPEPERVRARLKALWDVYDSPVGPEVDALTQLLCLTEEASAMPPRERYRLLAQFFDVLGGRRPVLVWLDDVHWSMEALDFVEYCFTERPDLNALFLLTVQDEALPQAPEAHKHLREMLTEHPIDTLKLDPLSVADLRTLIESHLQIDPTLAQELAERTEGNALFALQTLTDWVQKGMLKPSHKGFRVDPDVKLKLPTSLQHIWHDRLIEVLSAHDEMVARSLELAAALGLYVSSGEWAEACQALLLPSAQRLLNDLHRQGLITSETGGWRFSHVMIHSAFAERAQRNGRWQLYHRTCADLLAAREGDAIPLRRGRHLLAAGDDRKAIAPLLEAARRYLQQADIRHAEVVLRETKEALNRLEQSSTEVGPQLAVWWLMKAHILMAHEDLDEAYRLARQTEELASHNGWARLVAESQELQGDVALARVDLPRALQLYRQCLESHRADQDEHRTASMLLKTAEVYLMTGQPKAAGPLVDEARSSFELVGDVQGLIYCDMTQADIARIRGDWEASEKGYRSSLAALRGLGKQAAVTQCLKGLAEVQRLQGRMKEARLMYEEIVSLERQLGIDNTFAKVNLAICHLFEGHFSQARGLLQAAEEAFEAQGRPGYLAATHVAWLPCNAQAQQWEAWDHHMERGMFLLKQTALVDMDLARLAELGAQLASYQQQPERAADAFRLAASQWTAMDLRDDAERCRRNLRHLAESAPTPGA